jgi:hypothetical protein
MRYLSRGSFVWCMCWIPHSRTRQFGSRIRPKLKQNRVGNKSDFGTTLPGPASARNMKCSGRSSGPLGRRKKIPPRGRQTRGRMMMMAVHGQSMPYGRTNALRGHLPPSRRCLLGQVIQTLGVPPHPNVMGPWVVPAALGWNQVGLVPIGWSFLHLCLPFRQRQLTFEATREGAEATRVPSRVRLADLGLSCFSYFSFQNFTKSCKIHISC